MKQKGPQKTYTGLEAEQRLAWLQGGCQARYRGEVWNLTWEEFKTFWKDERRWRQRGRSVECLVLTRFDPDGPWDRHNCCILTRQLQLEIKIKRRYDLPEDHLYKDAIEYGY